MKELSGTRVEKMSQQERQELLLKCIPFLDANVFKSKNGNEGEVFFINPDLIVKRYFAKTDNQQVLDHIFNAYCNECVEFEKRGYDIPKLYAWTVMSRPNHSGFDYYLLEQRVPGRELFISNISKTYDMFSEYWDKNKFNELLENPENDMSFYGEVIRRYMHDFIEMNERVESMSIVDIQRFLEGIYKMFQEGTYATPDVHARNVLIDSVNKMRLIDLYMEKDDIDAQSIKMTPAENLLLARVVALFNYNGDLKNRKYIKKELDFVESMYEQNEQLCVVAMKKVVKAAKGLCKFNVTNSWYQAFALRVEKILNKQNTAEVLSEMDIKILD